MVKGISVSYRLVLPTSVEDLDMMLSNLAFSKEESLSLTSCATCTSCNIIHCLFESFCSSWKLDSGGMVGVLLCFFLMLSSDFFVLDHGILLTSVLSISVGFKVPNTVALGTQTLLYAVLSVGIPRNFGFLWLILW